MAAGIMRQGPTVGYSFRRKPTRRPEVEDEETKRLRMQLEAQEREQKVNAAAGIEQENLRQGGSTTRDQMRRSLDMRQGPESIAERRASDQEARTRMYQKAGEGDAARVRRRYAATAAMAPGAEANRRYQTKKDIDFAATGRKPSFGVQVTPESQYQDFTIGEDMTGLGQGASATTDALARYGRVMEEAGDVQQGAQADSRASRIRGLQDFQQRVQELRGQLPGMTPERAGETAYPREDFAVREGQLPGQQSLTTTSLHPATEAAASSAGEEIAALEREGLAAPQDVSQRLQQFRVPVDPNMTPQMQDLNDRWETIAAQFMRGGQTRESAEDTAQKRLESLASSNPWTKDDVDQMVRRVRRGMPPEHLPVETPRETTMVPTTQRNPIQYTPPTQTPEEVERANMWTEPLTRTPTGGAAEGGDRLGRDPAAIDRQARLEEENIGVVAANRAALESQVGQLTGAERTQIVEDIKSLEMPSGWFGATPSDAGVDEFRSDVMLTVQKATTPAKRQEAAKLATMTTWWNKVTAEAQRRLNQGLLNDPYVRFYDELGSLAGKPPLVKGAPEAAPAAGPEVLDNLDPEFLVAG